MKLLFDENLSRRLVARLCDLFPDSSHVASQALLHAPDADIWNYAKINGYAIVTADADFYESATAYGPPPKVIWLRGCDYPTSAASRVFPPSHLHSRKAVTSHEPARLLDRVW